MLAPCPTWGLRRAADTRITCYSVGYRQGPRVPTLNADIAFFNIVLRMWLSLYSTVIPLIDITGADLFFPGFWHLISSVYLEFIEYNIVVHNSNAMKVIFVI